MIKEHFFIELDHLNEQTIFPFHIYVYSPNYDLYNMYLNANTPLTKEKLLFLIYIIQNGGKIAIKLKQKLTFLKYLNLNAEDIPDLAPKALHPLEEKRLKLIELHEDELSRPFNYALYLHKAFKSNNFSDVIRRTRMDASIFAPTHSPTVSTASYLAENLLHDDNQHNRVVATAYFISKVINKSEEDQLGELIVASFLYHLGELQIAMPLLKTPAAKIEFNQYHQYERHPGYSLQIIQRLDLDLTKKCKQIIEQHHELYAGKGYPQQTKGEFIDPHALILGGSSHIFEYANQRISSVSTDPYEVLKRINQADSQNMLGIDFGPDFKEAISKVLLTRIESERSAA